MERCPHGEVSNSIQTVPYSYPKHEEFKNQDHSRTTRFFSPPKCRHESSRARQ